MKKLLFLLFLFIQFAVNSQTIRSSPAFNIPIVNEDPDILAMRAMGSTIKTMTYGIGPSNITTGSAWTKARIYIFSVHLYQPATITGVIFWMRDQGVYTAAANNRLGLYTVSGGTATLVASCASDDNLWKGVQYAWIKKAFSSPYVATAGLYYIGIMYQNSAQTTAPQLGASTSMISSANDTYDFTNTNYLGQWWGGADLPASITLGVGGTTSNFRIWLGLY